LGLCLENSRHHCGVMPSSLSYKIPQETVFTTLLSEITRKLIKLQENNKERLAGKSFVKNRRSDSFIESG